MRRVPSVSGSPRPGESGQALVIVAVMFMAMMALLALGIDLALTMGAQRRFDQNGADAAALSVGDLLAQSALPLPSYQTDGRVFFGADDEYVYSVVRQLAGLPARLDPQNQPIATDWALTRTTGINQNIGLTTRTNLAVTLEYWGTWRWKASWCYSPTGPMPRRVGGVLRCELADPDGNARLNAPDPDPSMPYKVRVTVSSTTQGFFADLIGAGNGLPPAPGRDQDEAAACVLPHSGAKSGGAWQWSPLTVRGRTTCAQAVVAIQGSNRLDTNAPVIPVATGACQLNNPTGPPLFPLWAAGGQVNGCPALLGANLSNSYGNVIDFTDDRFWCDSFGPNGNVGPNYPFTTLMPTRAADLVYNTQGCAAEMGGDTWNRGAFQPDTSDRSVTPAGEPPVPVGYPAQNSVRDADMVWWIARGFKGDVGPGQWFPTYCEAPQQGCSTQGQNVAAAFYCTPGNETANVCTPNQHNGSGWYYFAKNQKGFHDVCPAPDPYGVVFNLGCRDVGIPIWDDASEAGPPNSLDSWQYTGGITPDRMRIKQILTFRIYCAHDNAGLCTRAPSIQVTVNGTQYNYPGGNSTVYGGFVSERLLGSCTEDPSGCAPGVTLNGNYSTLER